MTRSEFSDLVDAFSVVFPNFGKWLERLPNTAATFSEWFPPFAQFDLLEVERVIPLMRDGLRDYEPIEATNYEDFPRVLPKYARRLRYEIATRDAPEEKIGRATEGVSDRVSMSDELHRYRACLKDFHVTFLADHNETIRDDFDEAPWRTTWMLINQLMSEGFTRKKAVKFIHDQTALAFRKVYGTPMPTDIDTSKPVSMLQKP